MSMQERKKKKIVIASVLKPVDETRMFSKIGASLSENSYEVHILGHSSSGNTPPTSIQFHLLGSFGRLSLRRLLAPLSLIWRCIQVKPGILIVTTHELLFAAILMRLFRSTILIYDVQENYFSNILYSSAFPRVLRWPIAGYVRFVEWLTSPFIHHFFLAERSYVDELPFISTRYTLLENKANLGNYTHHNEQKGFQHLLFTGTLADTTGIFEAIALTKQLHAVDEGIRLTIIGFTAKRSLLQKIQEQIKGHSYIHLIAGEVPVPHAAILKEIMQADYGLVIYPYNKSTASCIPTKYYEYAASGLRMLIPLDQSFAKDIEEKGLGLLIQPHESAQVLLTRMKNFKPSNPIKMRTWEENEALQLLSIIKSL